MKIEYKEIKTVDGKQVVQITTADERWYKDGEAFKPSTTWIGSYYPKGVAYYKWLAEHGWDEAEALKREAGERGSKIHQAIAALIDGKEVKMDDKFTNTSTGQEEELTVDEWEAIMSFKSWYDEAKPQTVDHEFLILAPLYAGTGDYLYKDSKGDYHLLDFKTSQNIWKSHELQVSAYKHAIEKQRNIKIKYVEILQIGYKRNKAGYKLTLVNDCYELFKNVYMIWLDENKNVHPRQKDYPVSLKIEKVSYDAPKKKVVKRAVKKTVKKVKKTK